MTRAAPGAAGGYRARLVADSRWNLIAFACGLLANLVTIPFVVRWIGVAEFGCAGVVLAVTAPLTLIGTVIGQAVVREVSARLADADAAGGAAGLIAALRLCTVASAVVAVALWCAGPWITVAILGPQYAAAELFVPFAIAAGGWAAQQLVLVFQGNSMAHQDFRTVAGVAMASAVMTVASTLVAASALPNAVGYLAGVASGFAFTLALWTWVSRAQLHGLASAGSGQHLRALLRFGKWQGLSQLAGALGNQVDRYALGAYATTVAVGQYNIANRLQEAAYIGVVKAGEVLFPHFGRMSGRPVAERAVEYHTASWVVGVFSAAALAPMIPLAASILQLWIGPQAGAEAPLLLRTLVFGGIVGCGSMVFTYYAMGIGRTEPLAGISVLYSVVTVALTAVLIGNYGASAAGVGLLIASVVRVAAALIITRREFFPGTSLQDLLVGSVLPIAAGSVVAWLVYEAGIEAANWPSLTMEYVAIGAAVVAVSCAMSALLPSGRLIMGHAVAAVRRRGDP